MGQYYRIVNKTKKEYLDPHTFGNGLKLMEFVSDGRGVLQALAILLAEGNGRGGGDLDSDNKLIGSWAGDKVYVTGDYADSELFWKAENYKDISVDVYCCLCEDSWYKKEVEKDFTNRIKSGSYFFSDGERDFIKRALPSVHGILDAKERGLL